ncbi:hypothetical protein Skr01_56090 [Sphaerisporangium krabiense]|uniref:TIR domain-containing protein n=1 Tax=Sphaerisporangium krabiense TaxID=763782 RepID=A0A7W8ZBU3_9ACTN|nr:hypothetical protein [Sphaerisporangium krabiense]MBB5630793.1 hypothetical protein [Sphaerisporangium krabiense]GII65524.1 hypothetical protein Skr01_56090 [Sphaerisporangium krabiense]
MPAPSGTLDPLILISHRADDTGETSVALARELRQVFGPRHVHLAPSPAGDGAAAAEEVAPESAQVIATLERSAVVIVMIGVRWLADGEGRRRVDLPGDHVRRVCESALNAPVAVIPVYVDGARALRPNDFPKSPGLKPLASLEGIELRRNSWETDVARLRARIVRSGMPEIGSAAATREAADRLREILASPPVAPEGLEPLFADLHAVHKGYLRVLESLAARVPEAWEEETPRFPRRVHEVAAELRRLRLEYAPVRERITAAAEALPGAGLPSRLEAFARAVLRCLPTGELTAGDAPHPDGDAALDDLYAGLDGDLSVELAGLVHGTVTFHRRRWAEVRERHAALGTG